MSFETQTVIGTIVGDKFIVDSVETSQNNYVERGPKIEPDEAEKAFNEATKDIGGYIQWWGLDTVQLDGEYNAIDLRKMADYLDKWNPKK